MDKYVLFAIHNFIYKIKYVLIIVTLVFLVILEFVSLAFRIVKHVQILHHVHNVCQILIYKTKFVCKIVLFLFMETQQALQVEVVFLVFHNAKYVKMVNHVNHVYLTIIKIMDSVHQHVTVVILALPQHKLEEVVLHVFKIVKIA